MQSVGLIELRGFTPGIVALDAMEKSAAIELLQVELNDLGGACFKVSGSPADVEVAMRAGKAVAEMMHVPCISDIIRAPADAAAPAILAGKEFSPLIEQDLVHTPAPRPKGHADMTDQAPFAIGLIETQGLTAVIEAIDTACKAANVEVLGREKLGGGYITVLIKGDVAAVNAAVAAGKARVEALGLGKLIAAHVIPRPSASVLSLLAHK